MSTNLELWNFEFIFYMLVKFGLNELSSGIHSHAKKDRVFLCYSRYDFDILKLMNMVIYEYKNNNYEKKKKQMSLITHI